MQGAQVWSVVEELISHVPRGTAKKKELLSLVQRQSIAYVLFTLLYYLVSTI